MELYEPLHDESQCSNSCEFELDTDKRFYFLTKIENDLQYIFDDLCNIHTTKDFHLRVKGLLKKGSTHQKGDYFLSLGSFPFHNFKEELINKLKEIPYILECDIDENKNITLDLNRPVIFRYVLNDVMKRNKKYGMMKMEDSFLVLVHNDDFQDFNALRVSLIADHLISFLTANGAKVVTNDFTKYPELSFKEVPTASCHNCVQGILMTSELIENYIKTSKWRIDSAEEANCTILDMKKYVANQSFSWCGKDVSNFKFTKGHSNGVLNIAVHTAHYIHWHSLRAENVIHICLQSQRQKILKSALLLEMLHYCDFYEVCFSCQNTYIKPQSATAVKTFIDHQKQEVEKAMVHKYGTGVLENEIWKQYLNDLVDTAVKFNFLKTGINTPLKMEFSYDHASSKKNNGIFIQYNFARLSNIIKRFESKVEQGFYKPLPLLNEIDFSVLRLEEEWNLLNYILSFPHLIQETFSFHKTELFFHTNKICIMLIKLCHDFSLYYSRIRILVEPQPHLQKVMHARLWLLKGVLQVIENSLTLLNIQGLKEM